MRSELEKLLTEAKAIRAHAWLERFRKGNAGISPEAAKDIAGYVDKFIDSVIATAVQVDEDLFDAQCRSEESDR